MIRVCKRLNSLTIPVKDVEEITCDGLTFFCNFMFINGAMERRKKLIAILFNNKANQLLR